tara:strand:- start:637 stop:1980 length:1344 start_codon:yes stop_codon:yes gene_type:complete
MYRDRFNVLYGDPKTVNEDHMDSGRRLSFFESTLQQANLELFSSTIYCWARGTGPVELDHVRSAMELMHRAHPLLRSRIDGPPGEFRFVTDVPFNDVPLDMVEIAPDADINSIIEPWMNDPFSGKAYTWAGRFIRESGTQRWWLAVATHHSITDGHAALSLLDQCGRLLGEMVEGRTPTVPDFPMPDPIEHQLDPPGSMEHWTRIGEGWAERIGEISHWPINESAEFKDRRCCNTYRVHDEAFSRRLVDRCHEERTTVQGALASAVVMGISEHLGHAIDIDTITPVDLRRFSDLDIHPDEIACKVMCIDTGSFGISQDSDPWEVARAYTSAIEQQLQEAYYPPLDFTSDDITSSTGGWLTSDGRHTHGFALTNTGLLRIKGDYGPVQFEEVDVTAAVRFGGFPVLLSVYTYRNRLRCTYTWTEPILSHADALSLADAVEERLAQMIR